MSIESEGKTLREKISKDDQVGVSVALFGQPGAGKSSLINSLLGRKVAEVGIGTDVTTEAGEYEHGGLKFIDLPGYGTKGFPADDKYFERFDITGKDLFLCAIAGKLTDGDVNFFKKLDELGKTCIFVVTKSDQIWEDGVAVEKLKEYKIEDICKHVGKRVEIKFVSTRTKEGLGELQDAISMKLSDAKRERWERKAAAYSLDFLDKKHEACKKRVYMAAGTSALNGLNPIPGANVAVDVGVLLTLFKQIKDDYGLDDDYLTSLNTTSAGVGAIAPIANQVMSWATKEGLLLLLKRFATQEAVKTAASAIPFVGSAIAASVGFGITLKAGNSYLDDCHKLAEVRLRAVLKQE